MELELKHLAPYLPYDLKGFAFHHIIDKRSLDIIGIIADKQITSSNPDYKEDYDYGVIGRENVGEMIGYCGNYPLSDIKPILCPLSDLIDNILDDENDVNYRLNCELSDLLNTSDCSHFVKALIENKYFAIDVRLVNQVEGFLNKNHFDWKYNLIQNGLAIDINTLNQ